MGSGNRREQTVDLTVIVVPLQCYFLALSQDCGFLTDLSSIAVCVPLLDLFRDSGLVRLLTRRLS